MRFTSVRTRGRKVRIGALNHDVRAQRADGAPIGPTVPMSRPTGCLRVCLDDADHVPFFNVIADSDRGSDGEVGRPDVAAAHAVVNRNDSTPCYGTCDGDCPRCAGVDRQADRIL